MKPSSNDNSIIPANTKLSGEFRHNHQKVFIFNILFFLIK